ncbi:PREDICTED: androgen-dependent TFPI-regulating protein-like [Amphimedon queenslandica]|uniref:Uncharacterized protein n=1 Tax=Amphimedon queenslandica TaxID=400682 RepID=A0AAN0JIE8_AMPQE|nr:PREDICTED: androgen-dependent TFPI-regulating protein-like [Amphimedon queenslandica]|eukprot:XP_019856443.1 PREDICTED: androgen-dependent TFPI-regulating protein-like [Amphimedon queenslandica]
MGGKLGKEKGKGKKGPGSKAQSKEEKSPQQNLKAPKASNKSLVCAWHFLCLCIYAAIHWYDYKLVSECPNLERFFPGAYAFGGRWKYLTAITMIDIIYDACPYKNLMLVYYCLAFFNDLFTNFTSFVSWFFTTTIWPLAWVVTIFFWVLYAMDRQLIYPKVMDEYFPVAINMCWHVVLFPVVLLEVAIVQHRYPSHLVSAITLFLIGGSYTIWTIVVYNNTGRWTYGFMRGFNYLGFCAFSLISSFVSILFYYIGRFLSGLRWG